MMIKAKPFWPLLNIDHVDDKDLLAMCEYVLGHGLLLLLLRGVTMATFLPTHTQWLSATQVCFRQYFRPCALANHRYSC